ncbi:MAG: PAS domain-containing sensor histidine kinase [Chitinivibrionales bacterium]|nr:PAS domain-containing sensor histidine kinase [Chitinivibrionales bacterium]
MSKKLKQLLAELRESEARFKAIYECSNDAVMLLTEKGFFDCNPRTLDMFGFKSKEDFSRVHPADISPPLQPDGRESFPAAQERISVAYKQGSNRFDWVHRRVNGEDFPAEVLLSAFSLNGQQVLQATVRDITKRKDIELKLQNKNKEILDFTNTVTHDLKKPLTVMKAVCSLVNSGACGKLDGNGSEALQTGKEAINYMQELLDDLLTCAKLEAGTDVLEKQKVVCASLVEQILGRLKYQIQKKNIAVSITGLDINVDADLKGLAKIFMNLIGNSINYIGIGPDRRLSITAETCNGHIRFSVQDNGMGIPEESQKTLFEKFKRGSNVSGISGTGLGLSIVKGTVLAHGGEIWVESKEGKGTTFFFTLPIMA